MQPGEVLAQAKQVKGFRKIEPECCPFCERFRYSFTYWKCDKHDIDFGPALEFAGYLNAVEFICDDYEKNQTS